MARQEEEVKQREIKIRHLTKFLLLKHIQIKEFLINLIKDSTLDLTDYEDVNAFFSMHGLGEDCRDLPGIEALFVKLGVKNIPKKGADDKKAKGAAQGGDAGGEGGNGKGEGGDKPDPEAGGSPVA